MSYRTCEACGAGFHQFGRGRPAKRCPDCRSQDRYGSAHRATRAATVGLAVGKPCARCGELIRSFDAVDLDHADDGSGEYLGFSHRRCNSSAGASRGNAMRAAAYRQLKGAILSPPANGSAGINSTRAKENPPAPERPDVALGTVRERAGGGWERWSGDDGWVRVSRRW